MTKSQVKKLMQSCKTTQDWEDAREKILKAHGGKAPKYWWKLLIDTGELYEIAIKLKKIERR